MFHFRFKGEGMEVDTSQSTSDESAIRERLLEKVMARNGGHKKDENDDTSSVDDEDSSRR